MTDLLLTDQERIRFAAWLRRESHTARTMAEQAEKVNIPLVVKSEKLYAAACDIVAKKIESAESFTIGGP